MSMLEFRGLRADVPATHLAALGLLRAIDRHGEPARMAWRGGCAVLDSAFETVGKLVAWLAERFAPVPIVAPWQKGGCYRDATKSPRAHQLHWRRPRGAPLQAHVWPRTARCSRCSIAMSCPGSALSSVG